MRVDSIYMAITVAVDENSIDIKLGLKIYQCYIKRKYEV